MRTSLTRDFFERDPVTCARELVGCVFRVGDSAGIVVETEAYCAEGDEACHTFFRKSAREFVGSRQAGAAYVYLNYGVHWLANVLVKGGSRDGFVLLRSLEPLGELGTMRARRGGVVDTLLTSGPGRLTQAMGIDGALHGCDFCGGSSAGFELRRGQPRVVADRRIGISRATDLPWRFLAAGNPHLSRGLPSARRMAAPNGSLGSRKPAGGFCPPAGVESS